MANSNWRAVSINTSFVPVSLHRLVAPELALSATRPMSIRGFTHRCCEHPLAMVQVALNKNVLDSGASTACPMESAVGKDRAAFRNYTDSAHQVRVERFYKEQHEKMTYNAVREFEKRHLQFNKVTMGAWEALEYMNTVIDDSDPDTDLSQMDHALQAAEAARALYPELDWLHLVALIHDLGKMLAVTDISKGMTGDPQWAVVGDTFPVGCAFETTNVFAEAFKKNLDYGCVKYGTHLGIYKQNCGLDNVKMSWGHDEYMYQVMVHNKTTLPKQALDIIRFHSFYPWHHEDGYKQLLNDQDAEKRKWVTLFNEFDLYSKADNQLDVEQLKPYYQSLIEKYLPPVLHW